MMALQVERENVWRRAWSEVKTGPRREGKEAGKTQSNQCRLAFADGEENIIR